LGVDPLRLATELGLPSTALTSPDLWVPAFAVGALLERTAEVTGVEDFGLRLVERRRLSNLGAVGLVLREQPTLREALQVMLTYSWAENQALTLRLEVLDGVAILREGTASTIGRQSGEMVLGALVQIIRRLVASRWRPREVYFTHVQPRDTAAHRRVFGVTPLFGQEFDGLIIDGRELDAPISGADPVAAARALRYLDLEVQAAPDTAKVVSQLILALLPTGACTIERVAQHLGVGRKTLNRRLARENGASFTKLLNDVRVSEAKRYLAAKRSKTEIAERLGYGSLSAFSRWRRTAMSPTARSGR
jgi:AraC-like DNA-binding protein